MKFELTTWIASIFFTLMKAAWWQKAIAAVVAALCGFFVPIIWHLVVLAFAIMTDTVFGRMAAKKRGHELEDGPMRKAVVKFGVYLSFMLLTYGVERTILQEVEFMQKLPELITLKGALGYIIWTEYTSVNRHVKTLYHIDLMKIPKIRKPKL